MSRINAVIQKMQNDKEYRDYFFKKASNYQNLYLWLEPLDKKGYFAPEKNPKPIEDVNNKGFYSVPLWEVLGFLETLSLQNKEEPREETTNKLLEIVNQIIDYQKDDGTRIDNFRTDWYIVKIIFNLPVNKITLDHLKFIGISIKKSKFPSILNNDIENIVLPILLKNKMKEHLLELLQIIFDYKLLDKGASYQEREPLIEKYWLNSLLKKHSKEMIKLIEIEGFKILLEIIKNVISKDQNSFDNVWIAAIEEHSQNRYPDRYDNQVISFTRDFLENLSANQIQNYIESFLKEEHPIFKRLSFHTINQKYDELKDIFWQWIDNNLDILSNIVKHELYELLCDRSKNFEYDQFNKLIDRIEGLEYSQYHKVQTPEELKKYTAYRKKEWLGCLKEHNQKAKELYAKYHKINPEKLEHPGFDYWNYGVRDVEKESPIGDVDKFCDMTVDDIITYIKKIDPSKIEKQQFTTDTDLINGLANDLASCVKNHPSKFADEINQFHELEYIYKYNIINGFTKAWKEKQKFDWGKLFDFILNELNEKFFQSEEQYSKWLTGNIADLIEYGTKSDSNAFEQEHLPKAKQVLFKLIDNKEEKNYDDLVTHVLSSPNGRTLHALISYSLRYGRLHSSKSIKWENDVKEFFTSELKQDNIYSKSVFTILGTYLPHLQFLDKQWVQDNFNKIFPLENDNLWEISIAGYFYHSTTVYIEIYDFFKDHGHINKAIEYNFTSDSTNKKVVQHICVMFMNDKDNETAIEVIKSRHTSSILEIIFFLYLQYRDKNDNKSFEKIIKLWNEIYQTLKDDTSDDVQEIFSTLSKWFVLLYKISDEMLPVLKLTAKYIEKNHNSFFFVEEMARLVAKNPKYIGEIYLSMIENDIYPEYEQKHILNIIETLYKSRENEKALRICNLYKKKGIYFLNELSKQYS
jgi:hypothetical protein